MKKLTLGKVVVRIYGNEKLTVPEESMTPSLIFLITNLAAAVNACTTKKNVSFPP